MRPSDRASDPFAEALGTPASPRPSTALPPRSQVYKEGKEPEDAYPVTVGKFLEDPGARRGVRTSAAGRAPGLAGDSRAGPPAMPRPRAVLVILCSVPTSSK